MVSIFFSAVLELYKLPELVQGKVVILTFQHLLCLRMFAATIERNMHLQRCGVSVTFAFIVVLSSWMRIPVICSALPLRSAAVQGNEQMSVGCTCLSQGLSSIMKDHMLKLSRKFNNCLLHPSESSSLIYHQIFFIIYYLAC